MPARRSQTIAIPVKPVRHSRSAAAAPPEGPPPPRPGSAAALPRRRWLFRLTAAVLLPLLGLVILELVLRLAGYGYETAFLVRHPAAPPDVLVENQRFPWRFFPRPLARHPQTMAVPAAKPAGVVRLLVLGESAAEGDPAPEFGFSRILQTLLNARYPGVRFEVVNVAFTAISSHVILPIARDCQQLRADFWLVYMGNNEVIGPYGAGTVFSERSLPLPAIRAGLALKRTRLGQLLAAIGERLGGRGAVVRGWEGMTMFTGQQVPWGDPRLAAVGRNFERNLQDILRAGTGSGAKVVLSTVVANLRDCPPFASRHRDGLTSAQLSSWEQAYAAGVAAETAGDFAGAMLQYGRAGEVDDRFADLQFRWARCCLALGQRAEARTHFEWARDLDALRFRTDSELNRLIRQTAGEWSPSQVQLLDAERLFSQHTADGIPGGEWLYEHVHFRFAGHYLLARLFADEVVRLLPGDVTERAAPAAAWLSEPECGRRLAYTDNLQYQVLDLMRRRLEEPVYTGQIDHAQRYERLQRQLAELRGQNKPVARQRGVELCRQAVAQAPEDWVLHSLLARSLGAVDDFAGAAAEWRLVAKAVPHDATPWFELGQLAWQQRQPEQAAALFRNGLAMNPDHARTHEALGLLYLEQGQTSAALPHLRAALRLDPTRTKAAESLARATAAASR